MARDIAVPVKTRTLGNGLRVLLHEDRRLPVVHVALWYHVGSKNEQPWRTGFAHLFEHLMFEGSRHNNSHFIRLMERAGASLSAGGVNGTTSHDRTNYYETVPREALGLALWAESDRMAYLLDVLDQTKLDTQREVVRNERFQRMDNVPYGTAWEKMFHALFPPGHPYSWDVIGDMAHLAASDLGEVHDFFRTWYAPNNAVLVVAGDYDERRAMELVRRYFGPIPPGRVPGRPSFPPEPRASHRRIVVPEAVPHARLYCGWSTVPFFHEDEPALDMLSEILSDGLNSRLYRRMVYEDRTASDVSAFHYSLESGGLTGVVATARPQVPLSRLRDQMDEELVRMAEEGLSPVSLAGIEAEARRIAREQVVSGLPRTRLYADGSSSLLRANRAEGVYTGLGVSFAPRPAVRLTAMAGYGFAGRKPSATVRGRWTVDDAAAATTVELFGLQLRDVGPRPGASGALNTLSTLLRNLDYTDPYFATGGRAALDYRVSDDGARIRVTGAWEDFSGLSDPWSGGLGATDRSRPLRPVEEGVFMSAGGGFTYSWGSLPTWGAEVALNTTAGRWHGRGNATVTARVDVDIATRDLGRRGSLAMEAGLARGTLPHQLSFFLGGRGTLPGHPYRAYGGRRFLLAGGEASFTVLPTWLTARLLGGAGAVGDTPSALADDWAASSTSGWRGYAGAGLAALHDILRIDGVWGLPGGVFELVFSVDPRLSPFL